MMVSVKTLSKFKSFAHGQDIFWNRDGRFAQNRHQQILLQSRDSGRSSAVNWAGVVSIRGLASDDVAVRRRRVVVGASQGCPVRAKDQHLRATESADWGQGFTGGITSIGYFVPCTATPDARSKPVWGTPVPLIFPEAA
jgi:hypothetical protein